MGRDVFLVNVDVLGVPKKSVEEGEGGGSDATVNLPSLSSDFPSSWFWNSQHGKCIIWQHPMFVNIIRYTFGDFIFNLLCETQPSRHFICMERRLNFILFSYDSSERVDFCHPSSDFKYKGVRNVRFDGELKNKLKFFSCIS